MENIEKQFIRAGDITLHTVFAGPEDGEPIVLLHGFPEFWYGWRVQIPVLAEAGYRVIVPDQRGYNLSEKPSGVQSYSIGTLARDVKNLVETLGYEQVYLVGHDWGAAVAWAVSLIYPELLKKLVIINVPHPGVMQKQFQSLNLQQISKSWYIGFFQIPALPEVLLSANNYANMARAMTGSSLPETFSEAEIAEYKRAWDQPGALTAMINWYRAIARRTGRSGGSMSADSARVTVPTLILWGEQDVALEKSMAKDSVELCEDGELIYFPNATHWLQHDKPNAVNRELLAFLQPAPAAEPV